MERERIRLLLGGFALVFALALIAVAVFVIRTPEVYLVDGGQYFVVLSRNLWGNCRIESGSTFANPGWTVETERSTTDTVLVFRYGSQSQGSPTEFTYALRYVREGNGPDWFGGFDPGESSPFLTEPPLVYRGMLHRFDDHAVLDYYASALGTGLPADASSTTATLLQIAGRVLEAHRDDLHARVLYLDALIRSQKNRELEEKLDQWRPDFEESRTPRLMMQFELAQASLDARKLSAAGLNGFDRFWEIMSPRHDLSQRLKELPGLLDFGEGLYPIHTLVATAPQPDFLTQQVAVKVARVAAELMLLQGERQRPVSILAGCYRLGQFYERVQFAPQRLVGAALRRIASAGLANYVRNACDSASAMDEAWVVLERLEAVELKNRQAATAGKSLRAQEDDMGASVRNTVSDAHFELVRMTAAAQRHLLASGDFPTTAGDFAPLLPTGPPHDPFNSGPLQFVLRGDALLCYSIGPDTADQAGEVEYDPTNGTVSSGDIVTTIPKRRAIPFPREAVRADSRADFMRQFPNGLLPDIFADQRGRPYGVSDSKPVCVYSYGPDTDQQRIAPLEPKYVPSVPYDPTNGTVSPGDIFVAIPPANRSE